MNYRGISFSLKSGPSCWKISSVKWSHLAHFSHSPKLNSNLHFCNTFFSHFFNQKRVLQELKFGFEWFYTLSYYLIDFRTLLLCFLLLYDSEHSYTVFSKVFSSIYDRVRLLLWTLYRFYYIYHINYSWLKNG